MKLVLSILVLVACSVDHRSDEFKTCTNPTDCSGGQTCLNGVCQNPGVVGDASVGDGPVRPDALVCPAQCTSCKIASLECNVDCAISPATCNAAIACPPGWTCNVKCSTQGSCRNGITCTDATACNITCSGANSCRNLSCGVGPCNVQCTGSQACRNVQCNDSCACDVGCANGALCDTVACSELTCRSLRGCSSALPGCNTCE